MKWWVVSAGLIDGINPCVFAVLVFFSSYLTTVFREKRVILKAGITFIAGVFASYFFLGLGGYCLLDKLSGLLEFRIVFNRVVICFAILFGIGSIIDSLRKPEEMKFILSSDTRRAINHRLVSTIRTFSESRKIYSVMFISGGIIAFLESLCTGQIYLPVIYTLVKFHSNLAVFYLFAYNICFVLPLFAILAIVLITGNLAGWKHWLRPAKAFIGLFLLGLAVFLVTGGGKCEGCKKKDINRATSSVILR